LNSEHYSSIVSSKLHGHGDGCPYLSGVNLFEFAYCQWFALLSHFTFTFFVEKHLLCFPIRGNAHLQHSVRFIHCTNRCPEILTSVRICTHELSNYKNLWNESSTMS